MLRHTTKPYKLAAWGKGGGSLLLWPRRVIASLPWWRRELCVNGLHAQDMAQAAGRDTAPDPLYSMPVPDASGFMYRRDTPMMAMRSAAPMIRESLPTGAFVVSCATGRGCGGAACMHAHKA